jgi:hypothetical protein
MHKVCWVHVSGSTDDWLAYSQSVVNAMVRYDKALYVCPKVSSGAQLMITSLESHRKFKHPTACRCYSWHQ